MRKSTWRDAAGALVTSTLLALANPAAAENVQLKMAYLAADSMLPALYAMDKGYFAEAGLDVEQVPVQSGPAAVAAVASGDADIGYAAPLPPINARLNGVNLKMFLQLGQEVDPDKKFLWLLASKASGIADIASVKGKKIAINANGGLCDLAWRDHLASAGLTKDDVEMVVLPFPEQEAALELGNIDAACTVNPFYASITSNAAIGAVEVAAGTLNDLSKPLMNDALFASDEWLAANEATAVKVAQVMDRARKELLGDRKVMEEAAVKYLELTPETATKFNLPIVNMDMTVTPADVQVILDAMVRNGMHDGALSGADFVQTVKY